jgi:hypothetical protein
MENVTSTITHLFAVTDQRDWQQVESAFDDSVLLDYTSTTGKDPAWLTPRQIVDLWAGLLPGFDRTSHQLFDIEINENQDSATAHYRGKAEHYIDNDVWVVEGTYETTLLKKGEDWVISQFKFNLKDWSGNRQLAAIAIERMKKPQ